MNCKQGDLAVIVKSTGGHEGKIVRCLSRYDGPWHDAEHAPGWNIDRDLVYTGFGVFSQIADSSLRPIRDSDGQDETLSWIYDGEHLSMPSSPPIECFEMKVS